MDFTIAGKRMELERRDVEAVVARIEPGATRKHVVEVAGRTFPVKQVFSAATGLDVLDFTTNQARHVLVRLGFHVQRLH